MDDLQLIGKGRLAEVFAWGNSAPSRGGYLRSDVCWPSFTRLSINAVLTTCHRSTNNSSI